MDQDEEVFEDALEEVAPISIEVTPTSALSTPSNNNTIKSSASNGNLSVDTTNSSDSSPKTGNNKKIGNFKKNLFYKGRKSKTPEIEEQNENPDGHPETPSLKAALEEAKHSVDLFLNNNFEEAKNICMPLADRSIYHALGYGTFMYLKAVMTFEQKHIEEASQVLSEACETISQFRRKTGIAENLGRIVRKVDYDQFTEAELHAELCHAECLLLKAALTFCEDETLVSFVKAGLKVRSCYQSFRECWNALHQRNWENSSLLTDFESGVRMGVGSFNLLISLLPGRIMKLLEFIGFDGNREAGLRELMLVYNDKGGMRHSMACFVLLGYNLILSYFIGAKDYDIDLCQEILEEKLQMYPDSTFFKFFKGRYHFVLGDVTEATRWYRLSVSSQDDWPQFHHICYWELYWSTVLDQKWEQALSYADLLYHESKWSRCMYAYQKAGVMCMIQGELSEEQRAEQIELMKSVPGLRQRIAGKSLPMEKFAMRKAERFIAQENYLLMPVFELIYIWNNFKVLGKNYRLAEAMYVLIEKNIQRLEETKDTVMYYKEDYCLANLLLAMCLKYMNSPLQAEECLKKIFPFSGQLKHDTYLIPYSLFEYAILLWDQGQTKEAMLHLECAKNDFKDYSLQSRLHFRIHAAQTEIRQSSKSEKTENSSNEKKKNGSKLSSGKKFAKSFNLKKLPKSKLSKHKEDKSNADENDLDQEEIEEEEEDGGEVFFQDADDILPFTSKEDSRFQNQEEVKLMNEEEALKIIQGP